MDEGSKGCASVANTVSQPDARPNVKHHAPSPGLSSPSRRVGRATIGSEVAGGERTVAWIAAGIIVGVIEVVLATSFAALIIGGAVPGRLADGVGLFLAAATLVLAIVAWRSGARGVVGSLQDGPAAVLAVVAASAAVAASGDATVRFLTVVGVVVVAATFSGIVLLALAALRLGNIVRFVPYPVVGGFLAGTGWLLLKGGVSVASGFPTTMATLGDLGAADALARWVPAAVFAIALLVATRVIERPFVIPAGIGIGLVLFAIGMAVTRSSIGEVEAHGWLVGPFPATGLWRWWPGRAVVDADWSAIGRQAAGIATTAFVCVVATLLNVSGIELMLRRDLDSRDELTSAGLASVAAGLAGGTPGFHALSLTSLAYRSEATARRVGLLAAVVTASTLVFGARLVSLMPRMLLGGVIAFLGIGFLVEWVIDARRTLPALEYAIVVVILAVIVAWGLLAGVAVGLVLAVVLFTVAYSRTELVSDLGTGVTYRSRIDRPEAERAALDSLGDGIRILRLHGYVFFGTANVLLERIRAHAEHDERPIRFLVLDLRRVSGLDASAVLAFDKVVQLAESHRFVVVFADVPRPVRDRLGHGGPADDTALLRFEPDLDRALQWCEDALLRDASLVEADAVDGTAAIPADLASRLLPFMERVELPTDSVLMRQGAPSEDVFVLRSGRLRVEMRTGSGQRVRLRTMMPGTIVGEIALYEGSPRTADVVSETPCVVLLLRRSMLTRLEKEEPALAADVHRWFATILARRLSETLAMLDPLLD
jgi:sulfate permease, SulP family